MRFIILAACLCSLSSCWRMPEDGEVSTLPNLNNPTTTHQKPNQIVSPQVEY